MSIGANDFRAPPFAGCRASSIPSRRRTGFPAIDPLVAVAVLELLRNKAGVREIPEFQSYCLWLGYRGQQLPQSIADTGSIILKQKIEAWARATEALGLTPVLKISRRLRASVDDNQ